MDKGGFRNARGGRKFPKHNGCVKIPLEDYWTVEHDVFVRYLYSCDFDSDMIKDRFLRQFPSVLEVIGVEPKDLTPEMIGQRISAIGGRIWRAKNISNEQAAIRSKAIHFEWGLDLAIEIESIPSAEVEEKDVEPMGLFWDWMPKKDTEGPSKVAVSRALKPEDAERCREWGEEWDRRISAAANNPNKGWIW